MKTPKEIRDILGQCIGTTRYHVFSPFKEFPVITDGIYALAEAAECYWLLDIIGSYQSNSKLDRYFQVWRLTKNEDGSAVVVGMNDTKPVITQEIEYTDFPLDSIDIWLEACDGFPGGVLLLPSEH